MNEPGEQKRSEPTAEQPIQPSPGIRMAVLGLAILAYLVISVSSAGIGGPFLIPLFLFAGWVHKCESMFAPGFIYELMLVLMPLALGIGGVILFIGARRFIPWLIGCTLLALLLYLPISGCTHMGQFIDG